MAKVAVLYLTPAGNHITPNNGRKYNRFLVNGRSEAIQAFREMKGPRLVTDDISGLPIHCTPQNEQPTRIFIAKS